MATEWRKAPQTVIDIAKDIIKQYHSDLAEARIAFVMRSTALRSGGKLVLGKARKVTDEQQVHIPYDFVIWLASDMWHTLTPIQKQALIDHELSHCEWDCSEGASVRGHDVEEFTHIIERYGFWWPGAEPFESAVTQAMLIPVERTGRGSVESIEIPESMMAEVTA